MHRVDGNAVSFTCTSYVIPMLYLPLNKPNYVFWSITSHKILSVASPPNLLRLWVRYLYLFPKLQLFEYPQPFSSGDWCRIITGASQTHPILTRLQSSWSCPWKEHCAAMKRQIFCVFAIMMLTPAYGKMRLYMGFNAATDSIFYPSKSNI